ncbi:hypothetical protein [Caloramator australicus]|uniref:Uncharacterized protein n=1 Tax=Caloramator australicus RC3 TaxID=857293 RepID=I7K9J0_9CLOT|nr:hypothetical protein [Caloramator australicus]CCJ34295.1 hypothetical protein CAAU_2211 [Caloramator australicus RC3]
MKRAKKIAAFVLTVAFLVASFNVVSFAAKVKYPKVSLVTEVKSSYNVFESIPVTVKTNYSGDVQYRAYIVDEATKKIYDIFSANKDGYYRAVKGDKDFNFNAKIAKPGKYHITVMVKRNGVKVNYDTYVKTKTFVVKDVKFALKSISVKLNGSQVVNASLSGNTFSFDLTGMEDSDSLTDILIVANKNAVVNIGGKVFPLSGNVSRNITPKMLGVDKNPPEGVTLASMREKADRNGYLKGSISLVSGKEKLTYNIVVKVK